MSNEVHYDRIERLRRRVHLSRCVGFWSRISDSKSTTRALDILYTKNRLHSPIPTLIYLLNLLDSVHPGESPLVLVGHLDHRPKLHSSLRRPVGISEELPREEDTVCSLGLKDLLGLGWGGDETDCTDEGGRVEGCAKTGCKVDLVAWSDGDLLSCPVSTGRGATEN